jgi:hypothetical protein
LVEIFYEFNPSPSSSLFTPPISSVIWAFEYGSTFGGCASPLFEDLVGKTVEPLNQSVEALLLNPQKPVPEFPASAIEPDALIVNTFDFTPKLISIHFI